jgi:hypothetical protein
MGEIGINIDDDLHLLDVKVKTLRRDYEHYFCGNRPREPRQLRQEVERILRLWSNKHIQNTASRFQFSNLNSRYFAFRQHWDRTLREIEYGTYKRHLFKADLHDLERAERAKAGAPNPTHDAADRSKVEKETIASYLDTRMACGESVKGLSETKVKAFLDKQRDTLKEKFKCKDVNFRVEVVNGKAKLKATPVRD